MRLSTPISRCEAGIGRGVGCLEKPVGGGGDDDHACVLSESQEQGIVDDERPESRMIRLPVRSASRSRTRRLGPPRWRRYHPTLLPRRFARKKAPDERAAHGSGIRPAASSAPERSRTRSTRKEKPRLSSCSILPYRRKAPFR